MEIVAWVSLRQCCSSDYVAPWVEGDGAPHLLSLLCSHTRARSGPGASRVSDGHAGPGQPPPEALWASPRPSWWMELAAWRFSHVQKSARHRRRHRRAPRGLHKAQGEGLPPGRLQNLADVATSRSTDFRGSSVGSGERSREGPELPRPVPKPSGAVGWGARGARGPASQRRDPRGASLGRPAAPPRLLPLLTDHSINKYVK